VRRAFWKSSSINIHDPLVMPPSDRRLSTSAVTTTKRLCRSGVLIARIFLLFLDRLFLRRGSRSPCFSGELVSSLFADFLVSYAVVATSGCFYDFRWVL
jgi:hypothetical protein